MLAPSGWSGRLAQEIYDEFLVCKICLEAYERPKCLACLHTFCEDCIESHVTAETAYKKYTDYRDFTCPLCRKRTQLSAGGVKRLPDNFLVASLAEIVVRQRPSKCPQCDVCKALSDSKQDATSKCLDCSKLLCADCVLLHRQTPVTSGHAVFNAEVEKDIECRSHRDEPVRFYCVDCEACICVLCTFHEHRGHQLLSFHDAAVRHRTVVIELLDRCRSRLVDVDQVLTTLSDCDRLISETEQNVHDAANAFIQDIRESESRLVSGVHEMYGVECMTAVRGRHELTSLRDEMRSAASLTELVLNRKDVEVLLLKPDVQDRLGRLISNDAVFTSPTNAFKKWPAVLQLRVQRVGFKPGSVDLGCVYDEEDPPAVTLRQPGLADLPEPGCTVDQETQTQVSAVALDQTDAAVQTESSSARALSSVRKDLPQFARPVKHFNK